MDICSSGGAALARDGLGALEVGRGFVPPFVEDIVGEETEDAFARLLLL